MHIIRIRELTFDHVLNNAAFVGWGIPLPMMYTLFEKSDLTDIFTCARMFHIFWDREVKVRLFRHGYSYTVFVSKWKSGVFVNGKLYPVSSYIPCECPLKILVPKHKTFSIPIPTRKKARKS